MVSSVINADLDQMCQRGSKRRNLKSKDEQENPGSGVSRHEWKRRGSKCRLSADRLTFAFVSNA